MDNEQARFLLQAYRPGGQDANDPQMAEALAQARRDPELGHWFAAEQVFDRAVAAKLKTVPIPSGLRESIFAGAKIVTPRRAWRQPAVIALAAGLAVLLAASVLWPRPGGPVSAAEAEQHATGVLGQLTSLDHLHKEPAQLVRWLQDHQGHTGIELPEGLGRLSALGCRVSDWNGRRVSLICFQTGSREFRDEVHLFVFDRRAVPDLPDFAQPRFSRRGDWVLASWTHGELSYLLAGLDSKEALKSLL